MSEMGKMLKRMICLILFLTMFISGVNASSFLNKLSLSLRPYGIFTLGGNYSDTEKLRDILNIGIGLGLSLRYEISENFYIDTGYIYNWISVKKDKKPFIYKEESPAFNLTMFTFNGTFFLKSGYRVEPYLTLGCSMCPWRFSESPIGGKAWPAPGRPEESFSNTDFSLNIGIGVEVFTWAHMSIISEVKYHYLFAKDEIKFGTDDYTEQDFLIISIGLIYYFK